MDRTHLQRQVSHMRNSLFEQGYLDDQFVQLEDLQDDANPNFCEEIVTLYYNDSARLIQNVERALNQRPTNFEKLDDYMHQFKGSSSSIGAKRVKMECSQFKEYCNAQDLEGCIRSFQNMKQENANLRSKLQAYFQLARQAGGRS